jgi:hypothetical protein
VQADAVQKVASADEVALPDVALVIFPGSDTPVCVAQTISKVFLDFPRAIGGPPFPQLKTKTKTTLHRR